MDEIVVPERMVRLGETLKPLLARLERRIARDAPVDPRVPPPFLETVGAFLKRLGRSTESLAGAVRELDAEVVRRADPSGADVLRAAERFEDAVSRILDGFEEARGYALGVGDADGWVLLAGVHLHTLEEVRRWISDLVSVTHEPEAFVQSRGLPLGAIVPVDLALILTPAPELEPLCAWAEARSRCNSTDLRRPVFSFSTLIFAVLAAFGLAHLFGCGDDK